MLDKAAGTPSIEHPRAFPDPLSSFAIPNASTQARPSASCVHLSFDSTQQPWPRPHLHQQSGCLHTSSKDLGSETRFPSLSPVRSSATPLFLGNSPTGSSPLSPATSRFSPRRPSPRGPPTLSKLRSLGAHPSQAPGSPAALGPSPGRRAPAQRPARRQSRRRPRAPGLPQSSCGALTSSRVRPPPLPLPPRPPLPSSRPARAAVAPGRETAARAVGLAPRPRSSKARGAPGGTRGSSSCSRRGGGSRTRSRSSSWVSWARPLQSGLPSLLGFPTVFPHCQGASSGHGWWRKPGRTRPPPRLPLSPAPPRLLLSLAHKHPPLPLHPLISPFSLHPLPQPGNLFIPGWHSFLSSYPLHCHRPQFPTLKVSPFLTPSPHIFLGCVFLLPPTQPASSTLLHYYIILCSESLLLRAVG